MPGSALRVASPFPRSRRRRVARSGGPSTHLTVCWQLPSVDRSALTTRIAMWNHSFRWTTTIYPHISTALSSIKIDRHLWPVLLP